jgi:tRNA(Ile)-lysidine synthase
MMKKVNLFIEKYHMLTGEDRVIAGISGGADSVCLLFVLLELRKTMGIEVIAVHVNHGIRGDAADADERFVQELCKQHRVECVCYHENVELIAKKRKQSVEETGRIVRREAFDDVCKLYHGSRIATAHHQNDNAETLLMNLARGTGLKGLGGIQPVNGCVIRPLLCLNRCEIESYVNMLGCGFCHDETNDENEYIRNRLRHLVIPVLEKQVNLQAVRHMNEAMEQIRKMQRYIDHQTDEAYSNCVTETKEKGVHINAEAYRRLPEFLQGMLVRKCLVNAAEAERDIQKVHIEGVEELFGRHSGRSLDLPYGVKAVRDYEGVMLTKQRERADRSFSPKELIVPGITKIPELNLSICCKIMENTNEFSLEEVPQKAYTKWFDYDIMKNNLTIRTRKSKDSIIIDKAGRKQKIKSYFINQKVPPKVREELPLIADAGQIVWIVGYRMSSAYQITGQTRRILEIKVTEEKK